MSNDALSHDPRWPRAGGWPTPDGARRGLVVIGVPTHRTSLSPTRADTTPDAIRDALHRYGTLARRADGSPLDLTVELPIFDAGNLTEPDAGFREEAAVARIAELAAAHDVVVALGGDNACTVPTALGAWGADIATAGLVTIDAHHDLRDGISNGSPVRRLIEAGLDPRRVVQIGIADFANSPAYTRLAADLGITVVTRDELEDRPLRQVAAQALSIAGSEGGAIHVDVDVDVCDRSVAPGCPASVPGGISAHQLRTLVRTLSRNRQVRSLDIAEIDAHADAPDGRTVRLGALVALDAAAGIAARS